MELKERIRWFGRMALLAFILGAVAFLSAVTAIRFAIQGREVEVPALVGLKAGDAQAKLAERGMGLRIADRGYSELPVDHVIRQSPLPGTKVKVGQRTYVVLSLGRQKLPVPELQGQSLRAARIELLRAGLQVGEVSHVRMPVEEPDLVLNQNPPPGELGGGSPRVNLLVGTEEPEASYVMPDLVGLTAAEAQRRIGVAGLRLARLQPVAFGGAPKGMVVAQVPARGAKIAAGAAVELQVAE